MKLDLSPRNKRALKALASALAVAAIWLGRDALSAGSVPRASIEALEQRYLLAREQAERQPGFERDARALSRSLQVLENRLLASASPSLAQAEIRSLSTKLLGDEGISSPISDFGSLETSAGPYVGIPLDLEFVCGTDQFVNFLAALANAGPILATRNARISVESAESKVIRVRLTVEGYLAKERAEGPSAVIPGGGR